MWSALGDMADDSRSQLDTFAVHAQLAPAFDDMADDVFVVVVDLFLI